MDCPVPSTGVLAGSRHGAGNGGSVDVGLFSCDGRAIAQGRPFPSQLGRSCCCGNGHVWRRSAAR